jgi:hypothetical protein
LIHFTFYLLPSNRARREPKVILPGGSDVPNTDSGRFRFDDISELRDKVRALEKDMWVGNGKPGMTTRMALMEDCVAKISENLKWIVRLLIAIFVGVIVKFFVK